MKKFLCGLIIGVSLVVGGYASTWTKIDVLENDVTIYANGEKIETPNFIYNDVTYVPLRALSETMGMEANYDDTTKTVNVNYSKYQKAKLAYNALCSSKITILLASKSTFDIYFNGFYVYTLDNQSGVLEFISKLEKSLKDAGDDNDDSDFENKYVSSLKLLLQGMQTINEAINNPSKRTELLDKTSSINFDISSQITQASSAKNTYEKDMLNSIFKI